MQHTRRESVNTYQLHASDVHSPVGVTDPDVLH